MGLFNWKKVVFKKLIYLNYLKLQLNIVLNIMYPLLYTNCCSVWYLKKYQLLHTVIILYCVFIQKQPPEVFYKKGVLRNLIKSTGKHMCQSLFLNNYFIKKETLAQVLSCKFCKISKSTFLQNISGRLLLFITRRIF